MSFVQIIECRTKRMEELVALDREYEETLGDKTTVRRSIVTRDRNDPDRYMLLVFFDSYSDAMLNSNLPETSAMAEKMGPLLAAPPVFHDLDVVEDRTL